MHISSRLLSCLVKNAVAKWQVDYFCEIRLNPIKHLGIFNSKCLLNGGYFCSLFLVLFIVEIPAKIDYIPSYNEQYDYD